MLEILTDNSIFMGYFDASFCNFVYSGEGHLLLILKIGRVFLPGAEPCVFTKFRSASSRRRQHALRCRIKCWHPANEGRHRMGD